MVGIIMDDGTSVLRNSSSGRSCWLRAKAASAAAASICSGMVSTESRTELSSGPTWSSMPPSMSSPSEAVNDSKKLLILLEEATGI